MKHTEPYVMKESLVMVAALTCAPGDASCFDLAHLTCASGHMDWSHVPHLPLLQHRLDGPCSCYLY